MKHAKIAEFKAKLSSYLRYVRKGESVTIYDRDTPVADVVPHVGQPQINISAASGDLRELWMARKGRAGTYSGTDSLEILLEDRKR